MRRVIPHVLLAGALAGLIAGCGSATGLVPDGQVPSARAAATEVVGGRCPQQKPQYVANQGKGLGDSLVPVTATRMIVCRYDGLNGSHPLALAGQGTVTDPAAVKSWRKRFNALAKPGSGRVNCPNDDGSGLLAGFLGSHGAATVVKVDLAGCQFATNGTIARNAGGSDGFLGDLGRLAP
jgi:hypothetical protein